MPIPPHEQLQAVVRGLTTVERDGKPARRLTAERAYPAAVEEVWDALTSPERVPRWMGGAVTGDLSARRSLPDRGQRRRRGARVRAADRALAHLGVRRRGELGRRHPRRRGGADPAPPGAHRCVPKEFWDQFGPGAVGIGWEMMLWGLHEHLTLPERPAQRARRLAGLPGGARLPRRGDDRVERRVGRGEHRRRHRSGRCPRGRRPVPGRLHGRARGLAVEAFDVLGDPVRRRILELLADDELSSGG